MTLLALEPVDGRDAWTVRAEDGRAFAVFATRDGYRVTDAACPHNGGPLVEGWLRDDEQVLVCPWHWFRYELATGRCLTYDKVSLAVYPVVERDGTWYADVGEKPAPRSWSERLRAHARGEV